MTISMGVSTILLNLFILALCSICMYVLLYGFTCNFNTVDKIVSVDYWNYVENVHSAKLIPTC